MWRQKGGSFGSPVAGGRGSGKTRAVFSSGSSSEVRLATRLPRRPWLVACVHVSARFPVMAVGKLPITAVEFTLELLYA